MDVDISGIVAEWLSDMIADLETRIGEVESIVGANIYSGTIAGRTNIFCSVISYGHNSCLNVATALCAVIFLIEFLKITVRMDVLKIEFLFSALFKLCVARLAISVGAQFLGALTATSAELVRSINIYDDSSGTLNSMQVLISSICEDLNLFEAIGLLGTMLIPMISIKIIGLIGVVLAWGRLLELTVYHVVFPLPCAALCLDHASITRKFMLSYFSVGVQGVFMMLSIKLFKMWVVSDLADIINGLGSASTPYEEVSKMGFSLFLACLIMIVTMMKSGQWAAKLCGV